MKKLLSLLAVLLLFVTAAYAENVIEGDWEFSILPDGTKELVRYYGIAEELTIPDGVTRIGDGAFITSFCVKRIIIPDSVTELGVNPFYYTYAKVIVSPEHPTLETIDGVLFNKITKTLISYPWWKTEETYAIPDGVRIIGDCAFSHCDNPRSITIPDGVIRIGNEAFSDCCISSSITLPDSVVELGANPFHGCHAKVIVSPEHPTLEIIDGVLFDKTTKTLISYPSWKEEDTYEIPDGILAIGDRAFSANYTLHSVTIPASVSRIGKSGFFVYHDTVFSVTRGSYAAQFCEDEGFEYID